MTTAPTFEDFCREVLGEGVSPAWAMAYGRAPCNEEERQIWLAMYGREYEPRAVHQRVFVKGRRAGGTKTAVKRMIYRIHTGNFRRHVGNRERLHGIVIAQDRVTAREIVSYCEGFYTNTILSSEVEDILRDQILLKNRWAISIRTCSARGPLGVACPQAILDETGVWRVEGASANVDREVLKAITPSMIQFSDRELTILGTPWIPEGLLHEASTHPFDRSDRAVFHCPTALMVQGQSNAAPILTELEAEKANDPENYAAAFDCQWVANLEAFLPQGDITAAVRGWRERPPEPGAGCTMALDASSLVGRDKFVVGWGHPHEGGFSVDGLRGYGRQSVAQVCDEVASLAKQYRADPVLADQFAFAFLSELMRERGVQLTQLPFNSRNKMEVFLDLKTSLAQGKFEIPDNAEAIRELRSLQATRLSGGGYRISAPRNAHDDFSCTLALLAHAAVEGAGGAEPWVEFVEFGPAAPPKPLPTDWATRAPVDEERLWKKLY